MNAQVTHTPVWAYDNEAKLHEAHSKALADRAELLEVLQICKRNLARNIEQLRMSNFGDDKLLAQIRAAIAKATAKPSSYLQAEQWPDAHNQHQAASLGPK